MRLEPDKIRFLDQDREEYAVTCIEVSDSRSLENFITLWIRAGQENFLLSEIGSSLWENVKQGRGRHIPSIFHRDDEDSKWSVTLHHYHVPYKEQPNKQNVLDLIELVNSVKDRKYISSELKQDITDTEEI